MAADSPPLGPRWRDYDRTGRCRILRATATEPIGTGVLDVSRLRRATHRRSGGQPSIDDGTVPAKRLVGDMVEVSADLVSDGMSVSPPRCFGGPRTKLIGARCR